MDIGIVGRTRDLLGEVPLWCPRDRRLWWVDVTRAILHSYDPRSGRQQSFPTRFRRVGAVAWRSRGGFVLATDEGLYGFDPDTGATAFLVHPEPDKPRHRLNDGRCDRRGRFWVGSMNDAAFVPEGAFYRVGRDLAADRLFGGVIIPNSVMFSPDDTRLYFADTRRYTIWRFDFDIAEGTIGNRAVFAEFRDGEARPDGSCVDAQGYLWNCVYAGGRLARFAPDGRLDRVVELPVSHPTSCCFGGESLDTLYVTSAGDPTITAAGESDPYAGRVLALDVGCCGLPEPAFAG